VLGSNSCPDMADFRPARWRRGGLGGIMGSCLAPDASPALQVRFGDGARPPAKCTTDTRPEFRTSLKSRAGVRRCIQAVCLGSRVCGLPSERTGNTARERERERGRENGPRSDARLVREGMRSLARPSVYGLHAGRTSH